MILHPGELWKILWIIGEHYYVFDRAERHDLFFAPFSSLLKKRGKKKRRMNSINRDQKSCLSARSTFPPYVQKLRGLSMDLYPFFKFFEKLFGPTYCSLKITLLYFREERMLDYDSCIQPNKVNITIQIQLFIAREITIIHMFWGVIL